MPAAIRAQTSASAEWLEIPSPTSITPGSAAWERIGEVLVNEGTVVRFSIDDPLLDSSGIREARGFMAAHIPFEVVPGPSRLLTAVGYAGIPLPLDVEPVVLATPAAVRSARSDAVGLGSTVLIPIAAPGDVRSVADALLHDGRQAASPAALVQHQASPAQVTHVGTLGSLGKDVPGEDMAGVLIVGDSLQERGDLGWFERQPLFGKRVLVTRATDQASQLSRLLREFGAEPIELPAIQIVPPEDFSALDAAVERLGHYDWVIFTSVNGVAAFFERVAAAGKDTRIFGRSRIAANGTATANCLGEHGLRADFVPDRFVAEEVVAGLVERGIAGKRALLPRAEHARDVLPDGLRAAGADVDVVVAYRTQPATPSPGALHRVEQGEVDIVTFASSSTVRNLVSLLGGRIDLLERAFIACLGPITAQTARDIGLRVDLVAQEYSVPGLVSALVDAMKEQQA
jgi:uroporphyrinogen-III synthase/siroheme synthase